MKVNFNSILTAIVGVGLSLLLLSIIGSALWGWLSPAVPSVSIDGAEGWIESILQNGTFQLAIAGCILTALAITKTLPGTASRFTLMGLAASFLFVAIFPTIMGNWQKATDERMFGEESETVRKTLQEINADVAKAQANAELNNINRMPGATQQVPEKYVGKTYVLSPETPLVVDWEGMKCASSDISRQLISDRLVSESAERHGFVLSSSLDNELEVKVWLYPTLSGLDCFESWMRIDSEGRLI